MEVIMLFGSLAFIAIALAINNSNRKKESDAFFDNLKKETDLLRKENEYNAMIREYYFEYVNNGKRYEADKNYNKAIEQYKIGLDYAEKEPILKINNFSNSIKRLIILYGKTKQYNELKNILERSISKYPNYRDVDDWRLRLEKLNHKLNKN